MSNTVAITGGAGFIVHSAGQVRGHNEGIFTQYNVMDSLHLYRQRKNVGVANVFCFSLHWQRATLSFAGIQGLA